MAFDYDLFVIGGGSGGVRAARVSAATGAKVAVAEGSRMGGTCVIRGCVPKKLMVYASSFRELASEAQAYGWDIAEGDFDWSKFRTKMHAELDRLEGIYQRLLQGSNVTTYAQYARLVGPHEVELQDGTKVSAKHILIATGGRPQRPEGFEDFGWVSDDVFLMDQLPKRLLVVGGGFIACELAGIFQRLGSQVTQIYRGKQILRGFDDEARNAIGQSLIAQGIDLKLSSDLTPEMVTKNADGSYHICTTMGDEFDVDQVLFATGRTPNTKDLGLAEIGVQTGAQGQILVNEYSHTSLPSVYAIGDVTNRVNLTPVAIREAMAFTRTVFEGLPTPVDHELIPAAVFTMPELGTVGLTEEAARAQEKIDVYATSFKPMRSAFAGSEARVMMKLIVSQQNRKVLGCHIVAPEAGEMIQLAAIAVKMGATKDDFDRVCAVHPTMAEELVTMKTPVRRD